MDRSSNRSSEGIATHRSVDGFTHLAVIVVVVVVGIGALGYYMYQNDQFGQQAQRPPSEQEGTEEVVSTDNEAQTNSSPSPDPTSNWVSFTGETFSFKFPPGWSAREEYSNYFGGYATYIDNPTGIVSLEITPGQQPYGFAGNIEQKESPLTFTFLGKRYDTQENIIDNRTPYVNQKIDSNIDKEYFILFGTGYPVNTDKTASVNEYEEEKESILQILSTFEYVGRRSGSINQNTYQDNVISFKYPPSWYITDYVVSGENWHGVVEVNDPELLKRTGEGSRIITISYWDNPKKLLLENLEQSLKNTESGMGPNLYDSSAEKVTVGNKSGYYIDDGDCHPLVCHKYLIPIDDRVYDISVYYRMVSQEALDDIDFTITTLKFYE